MIPPLQTSQGIARSREAKEAALRNRFFPKLEVDLSDIDNTTFVDQTFTNSLELSRTATKEEVSRVLAGQKPKSALGLDGISTRFLKQIGRPLITALTSLTTAC
jgi:hypothetical protein